MRYLSFCLALLMMGCTSAPKLSPEGEAVAKWFGSKARAEPLSRGVSQVWRDDKVVGWVFLSDHVDPVVEGKRGEIRLFVGLSRYGRVVGVKPLSWDEDAKFFQKIGPKFYAQFEERGVNDGTRGLDSVTGATKSSSAMIRDVMESAATVLAMPQVAEVLRGDQGQ